MPWGEHSFSTSESEVDDTPKSLEVRVAGWRSEWRALAEAVRNLGGADVQLRRAEEAEREAKAQHRAARRAAAEARQTNKECGDSLLSAFMRGLNKYVAGSDSRRSAATQRAAKAEAEAQRVCAAAAAAHYSAACHAAQCRADATALSRALASQRGVLATAAAAGAFEDPRQLRAAAQSATVAADARRGAAAHERMVLRELCGARAQLTKALYLCSEPRERLALDVGQAREDGAFIDEEAVKDLLPADRIDRAKKAAVVEGRRHMRVAIADAPHLPLAAESYVQQNLLNAFTQYTKPAATVQPGYFELVAPRVADALAAVQRSIDIQQRTVDAVEKELRQVEEKEDNLQEALATRREKLLFADDR